MQNDKESPFTLTLLDGDLSFQVLQFKGCEALNQPFRFDIEAIALAPAMNVDRLLQQPVYLSLGHDQGIHGMVHSARSEPRGSHKTGYHLSVMPRLQILGNKRSRRVFHQLDVPTILHQLLVENGLAEDSYRFELPAARYPARPFCIQFDETDLAFLQRLCEEEGIHFHFEHQRGGHVLVLADDSLSFPQKPMLLTFSDEPPKNTHATQLGEMFQCHTSSVPGAPYARPRHTREQISRRTLEQLRCQHGQVHGQSNQSELSSGRIVQISEHPLQSFNDQWLLTDIRHQGQQPSILVPGTVDTVQHYSNRFTAIPWSTVFRPARVHARPCISSLQPARVLGPAGVPAQLDERAQIHVRLWPDETLDADEGAGIWIPIFVTAPNGWIDPSHLPLGASEVLISFLDSDPDRPVLRIATNRQPQPRAVRSAGNESRLLIDWLVNR